MTTPEKPVRIALLAFEGTSAFHLSVPCLVFQDAFVRMAPRFELMICAENAYQLSTGSGFAITVEHDLSAMDNAEIIIIPSWPSDLPQPSERLLEAIRYHHQRGAVMVGLCLGSYVLACAGILDGKRMTTHWECADEFQRRFPKIEVDPKPLFIEHEQLITSAGIAASLDCCLHIVRRYCGSEFANDLARTMVTAPFRSGGQQQYIPAPISARAPTESSLSRVIEEIEQDLKQPWSLEDVASRCAMSKRTFTRQFKATFGCTFGTWLLNQRLLLSQRLLETTQSSISQVAELSGFGSESVFRKYFKSAFQVSPSQWRIAFRQAYPKRDESAQVVL
ncbi:GlxA family transcriptional regulator [Parendozoicomonas haliclonae]|uniref:HTH-type transcriptional regulator CdhR n=1 Tax=Parendozoicomonas haliclonae TaxID=1960125 RepID=A0A1X7ALY3_9GAMM|nr:AraC family transcriptional regulator [Parendozoicomonas haliclonae]SMA48797.1 HTH-type transcriptional regulator CdhR [Parendozoicomonas haliclonae]